MMNEDVNATEVDELADVPLLSIDDMLAADDTQFRYVDMRPLGWPGKARIGTLKAEDIIKWTEVADKDPKQKKMAGLRLLIKSLVDKDGKRNGREEHMAQFANKSHKAVDAIVKEILDLNGLVVKKKEDGPSEKAKND